MSATTEQPQYQLSIQLGDGRSVVAAVLPGHEWLGDQVGQTVAAHRNTSWTTIGHEYSPVVPIDVEGHTIVLRLPTVADAEALRKALAVGALSATILLSGTMTALKGAPTSVGAAPEADTAIVITQERPPTPAPIASVIPGTNERVVFDVPSTATAVGTQAATGPAASGTQQTVSASAPVTRASPETPPIPYYGDLITPHHEYSEWSLTLLDTIYRVPDNYAPTDLTSVAQAGIAGRGRIREFVVDDLRALATAARDAGSPIAVASAYRSHGDQGKLFQGYVDREGYDEAVHGSARPGHSEHQLGTTIDFKSDGGPSPWKVDDWSKTPAGSWMQDNAWRFGWIMSYPEAATEVTGYMYEPWHYRYIGREAAAAIHESGLTTREYLWSQGAGIPAVEGSETVAAMSGS